MAPQAMTPLENVTGLGEGLVEKLSAAGVTTVEALADMTPEQLEAIEGIGPKTVEKISLAVNNYFASLEAGEAVAVEGSVEGEVATEGLAVEGEVLAEEAAPEGAAEAAGDEVAADGKQAAAPEAEAEAASDENEEHEPKAGSAPETIE
jgi:N utilization substance protein A